jgi:hypothetical protein
MIGYILTEQQYNEVQGQYYTPNSFLNCVQDINGVWFLLLSQQDKDYIVNTSWAWLLTLPEGEYTPPPAPPFPYENQ